jgi:Lon-like protease
VGRRATLLAGAFLLVSLAVLGASVPAPLVALGRGPTFNTLGEVDGMPVVAITSLPTYPTSGHLNMTTVGVKTGLTMFDALALWAAGDHQVVPRDTVYPPERAPEEISEENRRQFVDSLSTAELAALDHLDMPTAVLVGGLTEESPSAAVLEAGDRLLAVASTPVESLEGLQEVLAGTRPGEQVVVRFQRGDSPPQEARVTLGARPDAPHGMLGVMPVARPIDDDAIVISLGDIGGPSAGLMFALGVVDKLTPGELTGGRFLAGTGTITPTGEVGPIRGIPFKMLAAVDAGATAFLVPAANCAEAAATVPEGLQLVKVADLAGAVAALDTLRAGGVPASC